MKPAEWRGRRAELKSLREMTADDLQGTLKRLGLSQRAVAVRLGVHEVTVFRWLHGPTPIPLYVELALKGIEADDTLAKMRAAWTQLKEILGA